MEIRSPKLETTISALLEVGDVVAEVSRGHIIKRIWTRENSLAESLDGSPGMNLAQMKSYAFCQCGEQVDKAFASDKSNRKRYIMNHGGVIVVYCVQVLPIHPDPDVVFVVAEDMSDGDADVSEGINQLDKQREFYENILDNIPADIAIFDEQHRYMFVNRNAFKNNELRAWMIGKTDKDYAAYSKRPQSFAEARFGLYDNAIKKGKKVEHIEKLITRDGSEGHHLRLLNPVFRTDGSLQFLLAYGVDISELVLAQQAIKASEEMFSNAFHSSGIGMALVSPTGAWVDVNRVMCRQTGYSKEELLQLTYPEITYPDDIDVDAGLIRQLLKKEISSYTIEKRYVSKERKIILVSLTVSLVWNVDNTPRFFIAQILDITKQKALEEQLYRKNAELEATRASLVNKIEQLEDLSRIIAHNLRGPAGNIKMLAEALELKHKGDGAARKNALAKALSMEKIIESIREGSNALTDSLATLMEITEIKLNKEIPYSECNLKNAVKEVITQLLSAIYEKNAIIDLDLEIETIRYPKAYLENILYNLISNSLKYCKPDVPPLICISSRRENGAIRLSVKDNGLGIDLEKNGDRLFKLNQVFHQGFDSKGIGLYITRTQVESLGGRVDVISRENEGCEFIVTI